MEDSRLKEYILKIITFGIQRPDGIFYMVKESCNQNNYLLFYLVHIFYAAVIAKFTAHQQQQCYYQAIINDHEQMVRHIHQLFPLSSYLVYDTYMMHWLVKRGKLNMIKVIHSLQPLSLIEEMIPKRLKRTFHPPRSTTHQTVRVLPACSLFFALAFRQTLIVEFFLRISAAHLKTLKVIIEPFVRVILFHLLLDENDTLFTLLWDTFGWNKEDHLLPDLSIILKIIVQQKSSDMLRVLHMVCTVNKDDLMSINDFDSIIHAHATYEVKMYLIHFLGLIHLKKLI